MELETELKNLVMVWLVTAVSLCYCYYIGKTKPKGFQRLVRIFPIVILFLLLPLNLYTLHFGGFTSFFVAWLANSKLLLFSIGKGPLASDPSMSLGRFMIVASLPIKTMKEKSPTAAKTQRRGRKKDSRVQEKPKTGRKSILNYTSVKIFILAVLLPLYKYQYQLHAYLRYTLYSSHIYLILEIILATSATLARTLLGAELEPQFDEPYLATSLQDFWARRWNIMVSSILKPTVYGPVITATKTELGSDRAHALATLSTFLVSGIMHEVIFYHLGRLKPTWEVMLFFLLQGVCLMLEVMVKRKVARKWQLPRLISGPLVIGFVIVSASWLFFPPFVRFDAPERGLEEVAAIIALVKKCIQSSLHLFNGGIFELCRGIIPV